MASAETSSGTRRDRTRSAIVAAARARFADEGFDGTTGARIAADAGVSEPTIAFHFGSKTGLLVAVMRAYYEDLLDTIGDVTDPRDAPTDRLRSFARWWLSHNAENFALLSVFGRQGRRRAEDEVVLAFRELNRRVTRELDRLVEDLKHQGVIRAEVPTRVLRDAFFGTAEHLMIGRVSTGRPEDLTAAADDLVDLLLFGSAVARPQESAHEDTTVHAKLDRILERLA